MVRINGKETQTAGMTIGTYLVKNGFPRTFIAVERNGEIVPKDQYDTVVFQDGDKVEVVRFVGGG